MNILVINNDTKHLAELKRSLKGHNLTVQKYKPGIIFKSKGQDLVVLTGGGGEGKEANDHTKTGKLWYQDEINFIKRTKLPIIGICMGFELIAQAYGSEVKKLPKNVSGWRKVNISSKNPWRLSKLWQFESHDFCVKEFVSEEFDILGSSSSGIEIIQHKKRPIIASQFHPEIHGSTLNVDMMLATPHLLKN